MPFDVDTPPPQASSTATSAETTTARTGSEAAGYDAQSASLSPGTGSSGAGRANTWVNMRAAPRSGAPKVAVVTKGDAVIVLETGSWYKIMWNGQTGYVYNSYVDFAPTPAPTGSATDASAASANGPEPGWREQLGKMAGETWSTVAGFGASASKAATAAKDAVVDGASALVDTARDAVEGASGRDPVAPPQETEVVPAADVPTPEQQRDYGAERAAGAEAAVKKLRDSGARYSHDRSDWSDYSEADCSKAVQLMLEEAGQGELFGRAGAQTGAMRGVIEKLSGPNAYRMSSPKPGDLMMWDNGHGGGHVTIVVSVDEAGYTFATMGNSGARIASISYSRQAEQVAVWGSGVFQGFWTPPAPKIPGDAAAEAQAQEKAAQQAAP